MLTKEEVKELKFFASKVAEVHGRDHSEYIRVNEIVTSSNELKLEEKDFKELQELTDNYIIPKGACNAQTTLLKLLKKIDKNVFK
jgi:iron-sulfur cluster repair protein YtfE (RIC family)